MTGIGLFQPFYRLPQEPDAMAPAAYDDEANYDANCNEGRAKISKLRKGEAKEVQGTKFT